MVARNEILSASRLLHTLKGLSATLGATALATEAAQCEKDLASTNTSGPLDAVVQRLGQTVATALPSLLALQATLKNARTPDAAPPQIVELNPAALVTALQAIDRQLRNADMAATEAMANLTRQFGPALGHQLRDMDEAVDALDFERASRLCQEIIARQSR
jgi:HPt (histidine-containing phosphotransfer) domain-containing protein